jgi:DNA modification methylase
MMRKARRKTISHSIKERSRLSKEEWREYTKTVWCIANTTHAEHPAIFPVEIPKRLVKLFTFYGEKVLDPFAGTGVTGEAALRLGRRSVCVDQNERYVALINERCKPIKTPWRKDAFAVHCADSRMLSFLEDNSIGLVVTSPPYWNKADYGSNRANLGKIAGYVDFIESLRPTFEECYRVLMTGRKLCVVTANVNQHTDAGLLCFPLAADITRLLREIGFMMVNELIWNKDGTGGKWGSWGRQRPIFGSYPYPPNFLFKNVHEYILVFAKPPSKAVRGPKVIPIELLMTSTAGLARPMRTRNGHH